MKLIKNVYGQVALLTNEEVKPAKAWLALQSVRPLPKGKWFRAYPVTGGSMIVQDGAYTVLRDAVQTDIDQACKRFHGKNPAAPYIQAAWNAN
jgi:hypothetical protein